MHTISCSVLNMYIVTVLVYPCSQVSTGDSDGLFPGSESEDTLADTDKSGAGGFMDSSDQSDSSVSEPEGTDLQAELAARLGVGRQRDDSDGEETKKKKKKKKRDKASTSSKPKSTSKS